MGSFSRIIATKEYGIHLYKRKLRLTIEAKEVEKWFLILREMGNFSLYEFLVFLKGCKKEEKLKSEFRFL